MLQTTKDHQENQVQFGIVYWTKDIVFYFWTDLIEDWIAIAALVAFTIAAGIKSKIDRSCNCNAQLHAPLHWLRPACCSHDLVHIKYLVVDRFSLDDISTIRSIMFSCTQLFGCSYIKILINKATWWSVIIDNIPSLFGWRKLNKGHTWLFHLSVIHKYLKKKYPTREVS